MLEFGFLVKKFITFFIEPFGFFVLLFFIGFLFLFRDKRLLAKVFFSLSITTLLLFSYEPFSNFLVLKLENKYQKYDYSQSIKYINVLGAGNSDDMTTPISSRLESAGIKRALEGIIIHLKTPDSKLIFTGYKKVGTLSAAQAYKDLALALGVDEKNIIISDKPKDTQEEALFTKKLLGNENFILVTSAMHLPRSMKIFQKAELNPIPAPTDFLKKKSIRYLSPPDLKALEISTAAVHEYIGILWLNLKALLT